MSKTLTVNSYAKIKCPHLSTEGSSWLLEEAPGCLWSVFSHNRDEVLVSPHPPFSLRTVLSIHMASSAWNYHLFKTHLNATAQEAMPSSELEVWRHYHHMLFVFMRKAREMWETKGRDR